jgi:cytoskeletal protein CcmA (bactofilin family)
MMNKEDVMSPFLRMSRIIFVVGLMITIPASILLANDVGERVVKRGTINDDLYLAGGEVSMLASVTGDVTVAGGELDLDGEIKGDLMAAGGKVILRGTVSDDVRIAGGELEILNAIGDDLIAAGGRLRLDRATKIGGRAWLSGGDIRIDSQIGQELRAAGGRVILSGQVQGDVYLRGKQLEITSSAVINGDLFTRGPQQARIAEGAQIKGEIQHTPVEVPVGEIVAKLVGAALVLLIGLMITGVVLYLMFPGIAERATQSLRDEPWPCLGFGLAVFAGTPLVIVILLSIAVGAWLALLLLAAYAIMLLLGYLIGALFVGEAGLRLIGKGEPSQTARVVALCVALLVLVIVNLIPLLGSLIFWLVLLAGMGALKRQMYLAYKRD